MLVRFLAAPSTLLEFPPPNHLWVCGAVRVDIYVRIGASQGATWELVGGDLCDTIHKVVGPSIPVTVFEPAALLMPSIIASDGPETLHAVLPPLGFFGKVVGLRDVAVLDKLVRLAFVVSVEVCFSFFSASVAYNLLSSDDVSFKESLL